MPRVSIGLPVYNGARFLAESLESLLAQDYADFELIISDNASSDCTSDICRAFAQRDSRIRYVRHERNLGASRNFNYVFHLATGEFFKWATHDDLCARANIRLCLEAFDNGPRDLVLCYGKTILISEAGQVMQPYEDRMNLPHDAPHQRMAHMLDHLELCHADLGLIRRDVLATTRLQGAYRGSDTVLLAELAMRGKFFEVPEPLYYRRRHPGTSMYAHATAEAHMLWFNPDWRGQVAFPRTRILLGHVRAIFEAPLSRLERLRCLSVLLRRRMLNKQDAKFLAAECYWGLRQKLKLALFPAATNKRAETRAVADGASGP